MIRHGLILIFILVLTLVIRCSNSFPTRFERIENDKLRTLSFVYDNKGYAEGAPGDTIKFKAYFAGKTINSVSWTATTNVLTGQFGIDTFTDTFSLTKYIVPGSYREFFGGNTDSVQFSFVLPLDILKSKFTTTETIKSLLPDSISNKLPEQIAAMTPGQIIDILNVLSHQSELINTPVTNPINSLLAGSEQYMLYLTQLFTMNMKVFALLNNSQRVQSSFVIRYNSGLHKIIPSIVANRNPRIDWIRLYQIKGDRDRFDLSTDASIVDTFYTLDDTINTISIKKGYSYFFVADSGEPSTVDSGVSYTTGKKDLETYRYNWFFRNEDTVAGVPLDSLLLLKTDFLLPSVKMLPPVTSEMKRFSVWLAVGDEFFGEYFRPKGFCFKQIRGCFQFY